MTKLANDIARTFECENDTNAVPVLAGEKIYSGALVGRTNAGFGRPFQSGDTAAGFALDHVDNTDGADGEKHCELKAVGKVSLTIPGVTIADVGKSVYATDDDTFALDDSIGTAIGKIVRVENENIAIVAFDFLNAESTPATTNESQGE